jgi:Sulfatase
LFNAGDPVGGARPKSLIRWFLSARQLDLTRRISIYSCVGLSLLYASTYFLPHLMGTGAYFLPSRDLFQLIVLPSLVAVAVVGLVVYASASATRKWCSPFVATGAAALALTILTLIGLRGITIAAGYDWQTWLPRSRNLTTNLRLFRILIFVGLFALVWIARSALPRLSRVLSSLGFAFGALAAIRLFMLWNQPEPTLTPSTMQSAAQATPSASGQAADPAVGEARPRRVVWVLFDETDFGRVYGANRASQLELANFDRLSRAAVFATNANSPASATLYSVPSLLTGVPIGGSGIRIDEPAYLSLQSTDGKWVRFSDATTIFGALASQGRSVSVLGFFHPYCKLFRVLQRCDSFTWPGIGGLSDALWANVPAIAASEFGYVDNWESITEDSLRLLPQYLARDDSLTFVHLNLPHLPAPYADKVLHLRPSSNPLIEYAHNLVLTDQILGQIVQTLQQQASRRDLLLVVSTDHWLRNRWYQGNVPEVSQPVPLIIWKVGETNGITLSQPLSTVHTSAMILDFLNGKLATEADVAQWWNNQPIYPSFIVPNN